MSGAAEISMTRQTAYAAALTGKAKSTESKKPGIRTRRDSAVSDFINRNPEKASHVKGQVRAGKEVLKQNGADRISRENMTMDEYKRFFTALMDSIPFDYSQRNCTEFWSITEEGWEQMKNDPEYEAWVLGYTVENRSVRFPAPLAECGNLCTEKFGASIEEHIGQSISKAALEGDQDNDDEESWWQKRHKKMKKLLAQQVEASLKKNQAEKMRAMAVYRQEAYETRQKTTSFLNGDTIGVQHGTAKNAAGSMSRNTAFALASYEQNVMNMSIFQG